MAEIVPSQNTTVALPEIVVNPPGAKSASVPNFDALPDESRALPAFDALPDESRQPPPSYLESAIKPITGIPAAYMEDINRSTAQMGRGVGQIASGQPWEIAKGAGNVVLGALGYTFAPIEAPIHTIVGKPIEAVTGSQLVGSLAEAGAGFALPIPKIPRGGATLPETGPFGVTLSAGEKAGDLAMRQREQAAIRGAAPGTEAWTAQRAAQIEKAKQELAQGLSPSGQIIAETPTEAGEQVSQAIRGASASGKAAVQQAYKEARGLPGEIHSGAFEGMPQRIKGDLSLSDNPVIIDVGTTPNASKMIDYLDRQVANLKIQNKADPFGPPNPENITGVNLTGIDQWRKNLSSMRSDAYANSPPGKVSGDARASQAVLNAFDAKIDEAVNSGMFTGDKSAINAWNNARAANADYQSTFGVRKGDPVSRVVQKIIGDKVNDPMTPTKVVDQIVGSSGVTPSSLNIGVANRVKGILGDESQEWIAVKQGVLQRLISTGEGEATLGTGQQAQRLSKFLNGDMAGVIYSPQEQKTLRSYANLMRDITMPPGNYFPSARPIQEAMAAIRSRVGAIVGAIIGRQIVPIPLVGELMGLSVGSQVERALEHLHSGVSKQLPIVSQQVQKWEMAQSAAQVAPNPITQRTAAVAALNLQRVLNPLGIHLNEIATQISGPGTAYGEQNQQNIPRPPGQ